MHSDTSNRFHFFYKFWNRRLIAVGAIDVPQANTHIGMEIHLFNHNDIRNMLRLICRQNAKQKRQE